MKPILLTLRSWLEVLRAERWSIERDPVLGWVLASLFSEVAAHKGRYIRHILGFAPSLANYKLMFQWDISVDVTDESYFLRIDTMKDALTVSDSASIDIGQRLDALVIISRIDPDKLGFRHVFFHTRYWPNGLGVVTSDDDRVVAIFKGLVCLLSETLGILDNGCLVIMHYVDFVLWWWKLFWLGIVINCAVICHEFVLWNDHLDVFEFYRSFSGWASQWVEPLLVLEPLRGHCCPFLAWSSERVAENFDLSDLL